MLFITKIAANDDCCLSTDCTFQTCVSCDHTCDERESNSCDDKLFGKTFYAFRPQDSNTVRRILSLPHHLKSTLPNNSHRFDVALEYQRSFDDDLASWFFFNGSDSMSIGIPDNTQHFDIDGSQLGLTLGNDTESTLNSGKIGSISADPVIENVIIDLDFHFDLSCLHCGFWTKVNLPIVHSKVDLRLCTSTTGTLSSEEFPAGLYAIGSSLGDVACASTGSPITSINNALEGDTGFGSVPPLHCGKFPSCEIDETKLAGLHWDIGYDWCADNCSYVATSLHIVAPTGTRPTGTYILEPTIGSNKSAQFGGTIQASKLWHQDDEQSYGVYLYAVGTHLFKEKQRRLFALKNSPGSQFLLLKRFNPGGTSIKYAERAGNVFCGETEIGSDFMFDGSLMFQFNRCNAFFNIGYNLWARTKEKREDAVCFRGFYEDQLGIKGNTPLVEELDIECCDYDSICAPNLDTASNSTISKPANPDECTTFIHPSDVDFGSALHPGAVSHKIFGSVGYESSVSCYPTYIALTGEVEFSGDNKAVDQWGIILKAGIDY